MSLKLTCPYCAETYDLERVVTGQVGLQYAHLLGRFGNPRLALVVDFLNCFRRAGGVVTLARRVKILDEVAAIVTTGRLHFDRRTWDVTPPLVFEAMEETARSKQLAGLTNLNYFKRVLAAKAKEVEVKAERAREEARRTGSNRPPAERRDAGSGQPERLMFDPGRLAGQGGEVDG